MSTGITLPPSEILKQMFALQVINLDPKDIETALRILMSEVGVFMSGSYEYDFFLSYRVFSDADVIEKVYYFLISEGYKVYWDKKSLKKCEDWKQGFLNGIKNCRHFVPFISAAGIAQCKDSMRIHSHDNVLIEYETSLIIAKNTNNPKFIW